jgi:hypothetical protein
MSASAGKWRCLLDSAVHLAPEMSLPFAAICAAFCTRSDCLTERKTLAHIHVPNPHETLD